MEESKRTVNRIGKFLQNLQNELFQSWNFLILSYLTYLYLGLRVISQGNHREEDKNDDSVIQHRIYCVEWGIGIATQEEFLIHLFTCRADAVQNNINNQLVAKAKLEEALDYDIDQKRTWFRENLNKLRISSHHDQITLVLSRDNVLEETINQFSTVDQLELHKDIKIFFIDEEARDIGGVIREWFSIVTEELFKPESKVFEVVNNNQDTFYTIHLDATFEMWHFAGLIFGKAIFESVPLDGRLSKLLLMRMLANEPCFEDLKYHDEQLYTSLAYLNSDGVNAEDLCMNFTIMDSGRTIELKQNGESIPLTNENKEEYIKLVVDHYSYKRAEVQTWAFIDSFLSVIPNNLLSVFDVEQLEQILFGQKEIDVEDWKNNTFYKGKYLENGEHQALKWFWEILREITNDEKRKFLQFCTGSRSLPIEGFIGLKGQKKQPCKFSIESISVRKSQFLRAHTCFNSLELPMYESRKEVEAGIRYVLDQKEFYFGLE
jgi:hypothetical protein